MNSELCLLAQLMLLHPFKLGCITFANLFLENVFLVFFDDILVYSQNIADHISHLNSVFQLMRQHMLFAKSSKCTFAIDKVEYLVHFISGTGVEIDPMEIDVVVKWVVPTYVKYLISFLRLAGYYKKFIRDYACISKPLTSLLKKGEFTWN